MKKCPTCQKTFDDNLRFCQVDGTPLVDDVPPVDDAPAFDPYATIVSTGLPVGSADTSPGPEPAASEPDENLSVSRMPISEPDDILEVPQSDPLKTMYASDAEMKEILGTGLGSENAEKAAPEEPSPTESAPPFGSPEPVAPGFGDLAPAPPPSPFSSTSGDAVDLEPVAPPPAPDLQAPAEPTFDEAATIIQQPISAGVSAEPYAPVEQWTPPPAPEPAWQDQQVGSNTPFQSPPAGAAGQSQGLAIASLVCGILSLLCCNWFVVGLAAVIMGFIARNKAKTDPANYTGAGMALGGLITGAVSLLIGVVFWILYVLGFAASLLNR